MAEAGKTPKYTALDLEHGSVDAITPSGSSSCTPRGQRSNVATPTRPRSIQIDDTLPSHGAFHKPRICTQLPSKLPAPVAGIFHKAARWARGPQPPSRYCITPILDKVQTCPSRMLARLPEWLRGGLYAAGCILWIVLFAVILTRDSMPTNIAGFGPPVHLSCVANLWPGPQSCGLDGSLCLPFDNSTFAFSCPAGCAATRVLNPRAIGNVSISYRSLVVGGQEDPDEDLARVYRGDSFLCGAAIHAGAISNGAGGCGLVSLIGQKKGFKSVQRNGIESVGFDTTFPMAFDFLQSQAITVDARKCHDPRWNLLALSTVFTALFGLLTSRPATFFAPVFTILFFQIGMASDPPGYTTYASLASTILGRFLPAALVAALFYRYSVRKTLHNCRAHIEKTVLWVGGAWVGALENYTFDKIPISRLTGHDIKQQPGAITALVIIVLVLFAIILYQAWCFRAEGRLPRFLALYALFGLGLGILAAMPGLQLRIHHYIIALLMLPGTSLQTRLSMLYQGLLVGLFINGIARWDFDSILQTSANLRADAQLGSIIPSILPPNVTNSSIAFSWNDIPDPYNAISVLVNDVERFRGNGGELSWAWNRTASSEAVNEYFRFGFVNYVPFGGVGYSDFTRAGTWTADGRWLHMEKGRTGI